MFDRQMKLVKGEAVDFEWLLKNNNTISIALKSILVIYINIYKQGEQQVVNK